MEAEDVVANAVEALDDSLNTATTSTPRWPLGRHMRHGGARL
jgi:hypothetical protein